MDTKVRGTLEMTFGMMIAGTIGWFVEISGRSVIDVVFWRCLLGSGTLFVICAGMRLFQNKITLPILGAAALGGIAIVVNWLLLFASYNKASISIATVVYETQPFILAGLGVIIFSERLNWSQISWLTIAFTGTVMIVHAKTGVDSKGTEYLIGILMAFGAAFFWAVATIIIKMLSDTPPHLIALIQVCVGTILLAPFANLSHLPTNTRTWEALIIIGVIHTGLTYILIYGAIQKLPTYLIGSLSFIYPIVAIGVDFIAFGRRLAISQVAGAMAVLIAAAGMTLGWPLWFPKLKDCRC